MNIISSIILVGLALPITALSQENKLDPNGRCAGSAIYYEPFCRSALMYCPNDSTLFNFFNPPLYSSSSVVDLEAAEKEDLALDIATHNPEILEKCDIEDLEHGYGGNNVKDIGF